MTMTRDEKITLMYNEYIQSEEYCNEPAIQDWTHSATFGEYEALLQKKLTKADVMNLAEAVTDRTSIIAEAHFVLGFKYASELLGLLFPSTPRYIKAVTEEHRLS